MIKELNNVVLNVTPLALTGSDEVLNDYKRLVLARGKRRVVLNVKPPRGRIANKGRVGRGRGF